MEFNYGCFSPDICANIGYYVYRLIDPRNGETFYVGKGKKNRIFEHLKGMGIRNEISDKVRRINEIHNQGLRCILVIHRHQLTELEAFHVEGALIDSYPQLTNEIGGYGCSEVGVMTVKDLIDKYSVEEILENDFNCYKIMLIKVAKSLENGLSLYDATRYAWRIDVQKAKEADYVVSIVNGGVIKRIFVAHAWKVANSINFPEFHVLHRSVRYGFVGDVVEDSHIVNLYENKKIPQKYTKKGIANPIQYNF